jgi:hypothetical protein
VNGLHRRFVLWRDEPFDEGDGPYTAQKQRTKKDRCGCSGLKTMSVTGETISPAGPRPSKRGGGGNRTRVQGFAGPCLSHSATPPGEVSRQSQASSNTERTTGFEPATLTLAR